VTGEAGDQGAPPAPVVIAHLSDLHFGAHDQSAAESLVADVAAARPTVTVVTGDLTQRARAHEFGAAVAFLGRLPTPVVVVLGNHDVPLDRLQRVTSPYQAYVGHLRLDLDPIVDAPGVRVLGLQSMPRWRWKSGRVSRRQADLVTQTLGAAPAAAVRVVALHHPVSVTGAAALVGRARLLDALAAAQVELVLAGHTHRASTTWFELETAERSWCVLEGIAGSATSTRLRGTPRSWSLHRVDATTITVEERWESAGAWATGDLRHLRRRSPAAAAGAAVGQADGSGS
jgi:3',5'-cyclic AMP phosphodiesterase CpdA